MRRILIGLTGSIAGYKVPHLIRLLTRQGTEVKAVCTPAALGFVGQEALRTVSGHRLYRDGFVENDLEHIRLAEWADLFCIAPATANTLAKISHGIADNLLTSLALSISSSKIIVAPAMNTAMWENAVTQENIDRLRQRGITVLPVGRGELACGASGEGRMLDPEAIARLLTSRSTGPLPLQGKRILISSGPTQEPIDPVRVITNRSSGKMGAALANAALDLGGAVTVVSGPAAAPQPPGAEVVSVKTAAEMRQAMLEKIEGADICIMSAAVSDFRPAAISSSKIQRSGDTIVSLQLTPNPDILAELGSMRKGKTFIVGFALETEAGDASARRKLSEKNCDMMILNRAAETLERDDTRITIITPDGQSEACETMDKNHAAQLILQRVLERVIGNS